MIYWGGIFDDFRSNMASRRPGRLLEMLLEAAAPFCLDMGPWGAVATPFMQKQIDFHDFLNG